MRRIHLDVERIVERTPRVRATEIRTADVVHEKCVARENHPKLGSARKIDYGERLTYGCMPGRNHRENDHVAERNLGAVIERRERERDIRAALEVDPRPVLLKRSLSPKRLDAQPVTLRNFDILIDVELRIEDRRAALTALPKTYDAQPSRRVSADGISR